MAEGHFGIIDYFVFVAVLAVSMGIGVYASFRGTRSAEEFLMGDRAFGPVPIAMSLLTSFVSAISLLGFTGETYIRGIQFSVFLFGILFGILAAAIFALPVIHPLKLTSVNEYLEYRFKSASLRKAITIIVSINGLVYMGICLYAPTLALATVTPISYMTYIFVLGFVVTIYSSMGGIRAVVWTDVFQLTVMMVGLVVMLVVGIYDVGGIQKVWNIALEGGRLDIFNTNPSPYERHSIFNTFVFGLLSYSALYSVSQVNVQRLCAVSTISDAKKVLLINAVGMVIIYVLIFGGGVVVYAAYAGCDPLTLKLIDQSEEIIPYFVVDRLDFIIGLPGVFVATLIGGALSSLSSVVNAVVAMVWQDLCCKFKIFAEAKPRTAGIVNKIISFLIGLMIIGLAILSSTASSLIQFSMTVLSVTFGTVYGVFLIGFFLPKTNLKGVWSGFVISTLFVGWIAVGAYFYLPGAPKLPLSIDDCPSHLLNKTHIFNDTSTLVYETSTVVTSTEEIVNEEDLDFPLMKLYRISYTLYATIGTVLCVVIGTLVSYLTGNEDLKNVSPIYITPLVRKLYWEESELTQALKVDEEEKLIVLSSPDVLIKSNGNEDLKNVSPIYITPLVRKLYWEESELTQALKVDEEEKLIVLSSPDVLIKSNGETIVS